MNGFLNTKAVVAVSSVVAAVVVVDDDDVATAIAVVVSADDVTVCDKLERLTLRQQQLQGRIKYRPARSMS